MRESTVFTPFVDLAVSYYRDGAMSAPPVVGALPARDINAFITALSELLNDPRTASSQWADRIVLVATDAADRRRAARFDQ